MILEGIEEVGGNEFVVSANVRDQQIVQKVIDRISMENKVKISRGPTLLNNSIGGVTISSSRRFCDV